MAVFITTNIFAVWSKSFFPGPNLEGLGNSAENEYKKVNFSFWHSLNYCVQKQKEKSQHQDLGRAHRMIYPKFDFGVTLSHVTTIPVVKNVSSETVNCTQTKVIYIKYCKQKGEAVRNISSG